MCRLWEPNSGWQAWQQVPLPIEPSCLPSPLFKECELCALEIYQARLLRRLVMVLANFILGGVAESLTLSG